VDVDGNTQPVSTLTRSQAARRERVIRAALELAAEGGYDVVQMRDVSTRAEVALGTIYRYFPSKDALLLAVMVQWLGDLEQRVMRRPPAGDTTVERIMDVLGRALRSMDREPKLTAAVIAAMTAGERESGVAAIGEVTSTMARIMRSAFPPDVDATVEASAAKLLGHVWWSATIAWANGMGDIDWVAAELREAAELIASASWNLRRLGPS
jgi:AcrR family transcriptional regulator